MVFIYATVEDAYAGQSAGGTGFLVSVPFETDKKYAHLYLVTNSHVAHQRPSIVIRFNTPSGTTEILEVSHGQWYHHPDGDDVAAIPLDLDSATYKLSDVPVEIFMTEEQRTNGDFGTGDECFVIGRNIGLEGERTNTPAARFGAVSIMSPEPIWQLQRGHVQDSIVVEAKSLGGYSGAPTFIYQSPPIFEPVRGGMERWPVVVHGYFQSGFAMLGITWGHMNGRIAGRWAVARPIRKREGYCSELRNDAGRASLEDPSASRSGESGASTRNSRTRAPRKCWTHW